jgi:DNA helicase-2/ATP-dependent DNA helicase PcrA
VRDGAFLERQAARRVLRLIGRGAETDVAARVRKAALAQGMLAAPPEGLGDQELVRQADLQRLVLLAESFDDGARTVADFVGDLAERFGSDAHGRGVQLSTYHRAKGLEFEAVFLPRLELRELPGRQAKGPVAIAEERRLLYVGITRAKRWLALTWSGKPSRFIDEIAPLAVTRPPDRPLPLVEENDPMFARLRAWRRDRARADGVPAYVVFHDRTLAAIADLKPATLEELSAVPGIGPTKLDRYGSELMDALLAAAR